MIQYYATTDSNDIQSLYLCRARLDEDGKVIPHSHETVAAFPLSDVPNIFLALSNYIEIQSEDAA